MTRTEMIARVTGAVRDSTNSFVTTELIEDWLNEAQEDLAQRTLVLQDTQTEAAEAIAGGAFALPSDFVDALSLRIGTDDVEFVDRQVWYSWKDSEATPEHTLAVPFAGQIHLYPAPANGTAYVLQYARMPAQITSGQDCELPAYLHNKVVAYAKAQALYKVEEDGRADRYMASYEHGLPGPVADRTRLHPGPLRLRLEPGPFDLDAETTHI